MKGALRIIDDTHTVKLHCFMGTDETKLKDQARTTRMILMTMKVIGVWGFEGTSDRLQLVSQRNAHSYTQTAQRSHVHVCDAPQSHIWSKRKPTKTNSSRGNRSTGLYTVRGESYSHTFP